MTHFTQTLLHLLLFALWFGGHAAMLVLLWQMRKAKGSEMEQMGLDRALVMIERIPRTAFVLMLPMGLELAANLGLFGLAGAGEFGIWVIGLMWLAVVWLQPRNLRSSAAVGLRAVQRVVMVVVALVMAGSGILSLLSGEPIAASWLAGKFILYGIALLLTFGSEMFTQDLLYAIDPDERHQRPALDVVLERAIMPVTILAILLYACLATAAYLGVAQPG